MAYVKVGYSRDEEVHPTTIRLRDIEANTTKAM